MENSTKVFMLTDYSTKLPIVNKASVINAVNSNCRNKSSAEYHSPYVICRECNSASKAANKIDISAHQIDNVNNHPNNSTVVMLKRKFLLTFSNLSINLNPFDNH